MSYLTTTNAAKSVGRHPATLRRWVQAGLLEEGVHWRRRGIHSNSAVLFDMPALRLWLSENGYLLEEEEQG